MKKFTDQELIEELKRRIKQNKTVLEEKTRLLLELEMVNKRLIESEKVKSQFLSNIKNEIKNPLTSILGMSKDITSFYNDKKSLENFGRLIFQEAFSLDYQLRNIFVAAELESGELQVEITNVNVKELISQILESLDHLAQNQNIKINLNLNFSEEHFKADAEKLHAVLINVIANSITFSLKNGEINIDAKIKDHQLIISIQDFGIGIGLEDQVKIYDRFKQLDSGSTKLYGGHGLGLSIVKDLLEMIDGEIELVSEKGKGSTFTLILPEGNSSNDMNFTMGGNEFLFEEGDEIF